MYEVKTSVSIEAAHRLYNVNTYSEECKNNIHGHSYVITFIIGRKELNDAGMVIDFKLLKKAIKEFIEDKFDHSCILVADDPLASAVLDNCKKVHVVSTNPTAEWMTTYFRDCLMTPLKIIDSELVIKEVHVQETEKNIAIWKED